MSASRPAELDSEQVTGWYLLICRECGNGDLVMPFSSAQERGHWAAEHTAATMHYKWRVIDWPDGKAEADR